MADRGERVLALIVVAAFLVSSAAAQPAASGLLHVSGASSTPSSAVQSSVSGADACISNGYLAARVDDLSGIYSFDSGGCPVATPSPDYILFPLGTSWLTVADFTSGSVYTEGGRGGGDSLGTPVSSTVVGDSIVTIFATTGEGLVVTQNLTVSGTSYATSAILASVTVANTGTVQQKVGVRYLWDLSVGGYGGTWLEPFDNTTGGAITGYEAAYAAPARSFSSYAISGCEQGSVVPPPYTCDPSEFGAGTFVVYGSMSAGPGATPPAKFVYAWWGATSETSYGYVPDTSDELGSYVPNVGGSQDSSVLYYFTNQTLGAGGALSDQADMGDSPFLYSIPPAVSLSPDSGPAGTVVTVTGVGLTASSTLAMTAFEGLPGLPLAGSCAVNSVGNISSADKCSFTVPGAVPTGPQVVYFADGATPLAANFNVTSPSGKTTGTSVVCKRVTTGPAGTIECTAKVSGDTPVGDVEWTQSGAGGVAFGEDMCVLSSGECSVTVTGARTGDVKLDATYLGDSSDPPSTGSRVLTIGKGTPAVTISCEVSSLAVGEATTCTVTLSGGFLTPGGSVTWTRDDGWWHTSAGWMASTGYASFSPRTCTLASRSCTITLNGTGAGLFKIKVFYSGDANNMATVAWYTLTVTG